MKTVMFSRAATAAIVFVAAACGAQAESKDRDMVTQLNRQANALRTRVLDLSSFAGLADSCSAGELRVFESDTAGSAMPLLGQMENLIISYGAGASLDNAAGRALLTAVARLETHGPGIAWDVLDGPAPRTFNAITTVRLPNPETGTCEDIPGLDPRAIIVPKVTNWEVPRDSMAHPVMVGYGSESVNELRDWFFSQYGNQPDSALRYVRVTGHGMIGDFATVSVQRESERQGSIPLPQYRSGAAYVLHNVGGEWRLIGYSRVW